MPHNKKKSTPAGASGIFESGKEMLWEEISKDFSINICSEKFHKVPRKHLRWSLVFIKLQTFRLDFHWKWNAWV